MNLEKVNNLVGIWSAYLILLTSCSSNSECTIFNENIKQENDSIVFHSLGDDRKINGVCFKKFRFKSVNDSNENYWGISNDTILIMRDEHKFFNKPRTIPFLPIKSQIGDIYRYNDYKQFAEDIYMSGSFIEVEILDKKKVDDDTIYNIRHTARLPIIINYDGSDHEPTPYNNRYFTISLRRGIIGYSKKSIGDISKLGFFW